jgi:PilZ domain
VADQERRRHTRYSFHMTVKVRRGSEVLTADIINASVGGCLLQMTVPLAKGDALDVNLPMLNLPNARLYVLRVDPAPTGSGYMVATCFNELAEDEDVIREASDGEVGAKSPTNG